MHHCSQQLDNGHDREVEPMHVGCSRPGNGNEERIYHYVCTVDRLPISGLFGSGKKIELYLSVQLTLHYD